MQSRLYVAPEGLDCIGMDFSQGDLKAHRMVDSTALKFELNKSPVALHHNEKDQIKS